MGRKRGKKRRSGRPPRERRIDGEVYHLEAYTASRSRAREIAEKIRGRFPVKVRVVKSGGFYAVYVCDPRPLLRRIADIFGRR